MARRQRSANGTAAGTEARRLSIEAVRRIDQDGAYANLLVPSLLAASDLDQRDRNLVTEMAYGATRMRRAVDWLVDRFIISPPPPALRASLRVGAYQLAFMRVPAHAAVSATVSASAKRNRAPVNAILRKVADSLPVEWPSEGTRLSYPDWLIARLSNELGEADARTMLETMNLAPTVTERPDGYIQDAASQWVVEVVGAGPGERILDLCAAPGGKASAMAGQGASVVGADARSARAGLVAANARRLQLDDLRAVTADGLHPPFAPHSFDRVLVDAPCSGLGVLRRRPDARWRVTSSSIESLAELQHDLLASAAPMVKPGGVLVYSVCTVTEAETSAVAEGFESTHPEATPRPLADERWRPLGTGGLLLPQDHDTDGMAVFAWTL